MNLIIHWQDPELLTSLPTGEMSRLAMEYGYEYGVITLADLTIVGNVYTSGPNTIGTTEDFQSAMSALLQNHLVTIECNSQIT